MQCRVCGKEIPESAVHCAYCGAPTSGEVPQASVPQSALGMVPALAARRFGNYIIDGFCIKVLSMGVSALTGYTSILGGLYAWSAFSLQDWIIIPFAYYFFFEVLFSKSPAKFITRTRVVTETGTRPTVHHIAIRSLVRCVPSETLSFLISRKVGYPEWWHDRWSRTLVVNDD